MFQLCRALQLEPLFAAHQKEDKVWIYFGDTFSTRADLFEGPRLDFA